MKTNGTLKIQSLVKVDISPLIVYDWTLMQQVQHFVQRVDSECHWYHTVRRETDETTPGKLNVYYYVDHILIPKQTVSGAEVETDALSFPMLCDEIKAKFNKDVNLYNPVIKAMTGWCHSHVNMNTGPSGTDIATFKKMCEDGIKQTPNQPQLMMIFNKRGEAYSRIFDPELKYDFENVPIYTEAPPAVDLDYIEEAIKNKLVAKQFTAANASNYVLQPGAANQKKITVQTQAQVPTTASSAQVSHIAEKMKSRFTKHGLDSVFIQMALTKWLSSKNGLKTFFELIEVQKEIDQVELSRRPHLVQKMVGIIDTELATLDSLRLFLNVISNDKCIFPAETIHEIHESGGKYKNHSLICEKTEQQLLKLQDRDDCLDLTMIGISLGHYFDELPHGNPEILRPYLADIYGYKMKKPS